MWFLDLVLSVALGVAGGILYAIGLKNLSRKDSKEFLMELLKALGLIIAIVSPLVILFFICDNLALCGILYAMSVQITCTMYRMIKT